MYVHNKGTNTILGLADSPTYVWTYAPFLWNDTYYFLYEHANGPRFAYDVGFGIVPDIIQFTKYKLKDTVYSYDKEYNFSKSRSDFSTGSYSSSINPS